MLLGLCGYRTSGKSEVAKILVEKYNFEIIDTKKLLRELASDITRTPADLLKQTGFKELPYQGRTHREIMGELGKTLENLFGHDYLLRRALHRVDKTKNLIVDSLRMDQALFFEGTVVEVKSDKVTPSGFDFDEYNRTRINYSIDNSGSLKQLSDCVDVMMLDYKSKIVH